LAYERNTVSISLRSRIRQLSLLACVSGAALISIAVGGASAATYPGGGSVFNGGAEGWQVKEASCNPALLCEANGGYDGSAGNPPGSLAANSKILVNAIGVLKSTLVEESPDFTVGDGGAGTLRLDRALSSESEIIAINSSLAYSATLVDKTAGTKQNAIEEEVKGATAFGAEGGSVSLAAGHTYAVRISSQITTSLLAINLFGGVASAHYDNVALTGPGGGGGGGGGGGNGGEGGNGANGLTSSQLSSLIQSSLTGPATLRGKKISVKAKCPAKVGRTCKVSLLGLVKKGKAATTTRTTKIKKGKSKVLVLKVKPAAKTKVASKKRLLFKETVKAGSAKATVYKTLKLIKR
jgi:hypothetical protein